MESFLSHPRRIGLMKRLAAEDVPAANARRLASQPHHLRSLDRLLSEVIERLGGHCAAISEATRNGNVARAAQVQAMLNADLAVFTVYTEEVRARGLSSDLFPRTSAAISARAQ